MRKINSNNTPTAAQKYRALAEKRRASEPLEIITCRSGAVFEATRPNLKMYMASGRLPEFLQNQMAIVEASGEDFEEKIQEDKELQEKILKAALFVRDLIVQNVRNPKIVEHPVSDNEIGFDELLPDDYDDLGKWMISGGGGRDVKIAENFRPGR